MRDKEKAYFYLKKSFDLGNALSQLITTTFLYEFDCHQNRDINEVVPIYKKFKTGELFDF